MGYEKVDTLPPEALSPHIRKHFPVTENVIYLNHAAIGPLCGPAHEAMRHLIDDAVGYGSLHYGNWMAAYAGLRSAAARLLNAHPDEIAIVKNTSEGISTVALGLDWRAGDRVVAFQEEFPSNYYPWLRLESRGVQVTWLSIYDSLDRIAEAVRGARLLAVSHVNYLSGYRVDLQAIGRICRESDCFFFVDAIQGLGVYPIDVEAFCIDALAADGHKWLLGPEGNGILYVRKDRFESIEPYEFGWTNPASYGDYSSRDMTLRADAGRYECGTLNTVGCFGLRASIEFLLQLGIDQIQKGTDARAEQIEAGVLAKGYEPLVKRTPATGSGIVSFRHPAIDCRAIVNDLKQHNILAAPRQGWVRMAPHFYLLEKEIDEVLNRLPPV
jgi:cysteine desulfurase / selenocysteine lyase